MVEVLADNTLDLTETPCGNIQVQAVAQQSLEEAAQLLALESTQSTRPGQQLFNLLRGGRVLDWTDSIDELLSQNLPETVTSVGARRGAARRSSAPRSSHPGGQGRAHYCPSAYK